MAPVHTLVFLTPWFQNMISGPLSYRVFRESDPWAFIFFLLSMVAWNSVKFPFRFTDGQEAIPWVSFLHFVVFFLYYVFLSSGILSCFITQGGMEGLDILFKSQSLCLKFWLARILQSKFWFWPLSIDNCFRSSPGNSKLSTSGSRAFSSPSVFHK